MCKSNEKERGIEMEENKKYVNMALLIVLTLIIVITGVVSTYLVYNNVWKKESNTETTNKTLDYSYEIDSTEIVDTIS